jgi:hypothetical protein
MKRNRAPKEPPLEILRDALDSVGIHMPMDILRKASSDEKAALAQIVVDKRAASRRPRSKKRR